MNKRRENATRRVLRNMGRRRYPLVLQGALVGALAGVVAVAYRLGIDKSGLLLTQILDTCAENRVLIPLWFAMLIVIAAVVAKIGEYEPMSTGSGIPQVEGELYGLFDPCWWKVLLAKFISGIMVIGCGLSMGREGPSVQLGAMTGKGVSRLWKRDKVDEKVLMTAGAGAGLAAAFNAPLAGLLFSLEEVHKNFSVDMTLATMAACVTADFVSKNVFGLQPSIQFSNVEVLPLAMVWVPLLMGALLGLLGAFYNWCSNATQNLYGMLKGWKARHKIYLPFLFAGVFGFLFPYVLADGHKLLDFMVDERPALGLLLLILVIKYLFSMMCFGSNAPGGTLVPMIVLGALIGGCVGTVAVEQLGVDEALFQNFILLGMTGYFAAIVKAPITGIILTCEITGSFRQFLNYSLVALVAYVVSDLCRSKPLYDQLLERIIRLKGGEEKKDVSLRKKGLLELTVLQGSYGQGRSIKEIRWPKHCLVVSVQRGEREVIPKGDTRLQAGDLLVVLADEEMMYFVKEQLQQTFGECEERERKKEGQT